MDGVCAVASSGPIEAILLDLLDPLLLLIEPDDEVARDPRSRVLDPFVGDVCVDGRFRRHLDDEQKVIPHRVDVVGLAIADPNIGIANVQPPVGCRRIGIGEPCRDVGIHDHARPAGTSTRLQQSREPPHDPAVQRTLRHHPHNPAVDDLDVAPLVRGSVQEGLSGQSLLTLLDRKSVV